MGALSIQVTKAIGLGVRVVREEKKSKVRSLEHEYLEGEPAKETGQVSQVRQLRSQDNMMPQKPWEEVISWRKWTAGSNDAEKSCQMRRY